MSKEYIVVMVREKRGNETGNRATFESEYADNPQEAEARVLGRFSEHWKAQGVYERVL